MSTTPSISRRRFLQSAGAATFLAGGLSAQTTTSPSATSLARNLIFMVADGMNIGALSLADTYRRQTSGQASHWVTMLNQHPVRRSLVETHSANSLVTDSAAAASAWGIGQRVNNRALNVTPDGRQPEPIWISAQQAGKATGLVTTTRMTHATPAGFAVNVPHRDQEDEIARQYLRRGIDVLFGGGAQHFDAEKRADGADLWAEYRQSGYALARHKDELTALPLEASARWLGIFADSHIPYDVDRLHEPALLRSVPTLAEMTNLALQRLTLAPEGFVLQVEGGRVDHAGHANDAGSLLFDQIAFDQAVKVALDFTEANPDTLLIVTTDHGTGGININGVGRDYAETNVAFDRLAGWRHSFEFMFEPILAAENNEAVLLLLRDSTGLELEMNHLAELWPALQAVRSGEATPWSLSEILGRAMRPFTSVGWTSSQHTGDLVELTALGPGSAAIPPFSRNDELRGWLLPALGVHA